jgi:hypothetical protein
METIKEAIETMIPDALDPDEILPARAGYLVKLERNGFSEGVVWAERWISPDKELPPIGKDVTVLLKGKDENGKETFNVHTFDEIVSHKRLKGWFDFYGFTHWRPIEHK